MIPDGIRVIAEDAFADCEEVETIRIPSTVKYIGKGVFNGTKWLTNKQKENPVVVVNNILVDASTYVGALEISDSIVGYVENCLGESKTITELKFSSKIKCLDKPMYEVYIPIKKVIFNKEIEEIDDSFIPKEVEEVQFLGKLKKFPGICTSYLKKIVIGEGNKIIPNRFLYGATNLEEVIIQEGCEEIGESAFYNCASLKKIEIPKSTKKIGDFCFQFCADLEEVIIQEECEEIGEYAFYNCTSLKKIGIPKGTKIGKYGFVGCANLEEVTIQEGYEEIGEGVFASCTNLKSIVIPKSVEVIGKYAFSSCTNLEEVTIQEGCKEIGESAFSGCEKLKLVQLPKSIEVIGKFAFERDIAIACYCDTCAEEYARKNEIRIKKLYELPCEQTIKIKVNGENSIEKQQENINGFQIQIINEKYADYSYDEEDKATVLMKDAKVHIVLPKGYCMADTNSSNTIEFGDISVGETIEKSVSIKRNGEPVEDPYLTMSCTLETANQKTIQREIALASYGMKNSKLEKDGIVAKVEDMRITTNDELKSTEPDEVLSSYGTIASTSEYWVDDKYYIMYQTEVSGKWQVNVIVLNRNYEELERVTLPYKEGFELYGNVIVDKNGYYYVACGHNDKTHTSANSTKVIAFVKYNSKGGIVGVVEYASDETNISENIEYFEVKNPFDAGECSLLIDSTGRLICHTCCIMYNGHQSNRMFYVNTDTMEKLSYKGPYVSHSFEQMLFEDSEHAIVSLNKGDAAPRACQIGKLGSDGEYQGDYNIFHYRYSTGYTSNCTFASLGGFADLEAGYLLSGVSEQELSCDKQTAGTSKQLNLYIQLVNKDFTSGRDLKDMQLLKTEERKATGDFSNEDSIPYYLKARVRDYGVLWLTNYKGTEHVSCAKTVKLSSDTAAILWEVKDGFKYEATYYCIVNAKGEIVQTQTQLQNVRLSSFDTLHYDGTYIVWTTRDDTKTTDLLLHKLKVGEEMTPVVTQAPPQTPEPTEEIDQSEATKKPAAKIGKTTQVKVKRVKGRKIQITWKKVSHSVSYQVEIAQNKAFTKKKKVYKTKKLKYTSNTLQKKKVYYIRVRAVGKKVNGKIQYGAYSKVCKITIK